MCLESERQLASCAVVLHAAVGDLLTILHTLPASRQSMSFAVTHRHTQAVIFVVVAVRTALVWVFALSLAPLTPWLAVCSARQHLRVVQRTLRRSLWHSCALLRHHLPLRCTVLPRWSVVLLRVKGGHTRVMLCVEG